MNEGRQRRCPQHDRGYCILPWQAVSASHEHRCRSNVAAPLVQPTRPKVIPGHMLEDEEAGRKDQEKQEAQYIRHARVRLAKPRRTTYRAAKVRPVQATR